MLGCPFILYGMQFFINFGTGTDLDNVYRVVSLSHTLSPGSFITSITLTPTNQGDMKPFRSKLEDAQQVLKIAEKAKPKEAQ
jgi:hypothetical protein